MTIIAAPCHYKMGNKKSTTVSQTHFGTVIIFCLFSFFKKKKQEAWGKGREISFFQHKIVRCFRLAHHTLGNEVVLKNWPTLPQPNSPMDGLALGWYKPI